MFYSFTLAALATLVLAFVGRTVRSNRIDQTADQDHLASIDALHAQKEKVKLEVPENEFEQEDINKQIEDLDAKIRDLKGKKESGMTKNEERAFGSFGILVLFCFLCLISGMAAFWYWGDTAQSIAGYNSQSAVIENHREQIRNLRTDLHSLPGQSGESHVVVNADAPKANYLSSLSESIQAESDARNRKVELAIELKAREMSPRGDIFWFLPCPGDVCED